MNPAYGYQSGGYGGYSMPATPFERVQANAYRHEESTNGMLTGGAVGAVTGAAAGAATASKFGKFLPGPLKNLSTMGGAVIGGVAGLLGGGTGGKKLGEFDALQRDSGDYKIDGANYGQSLLQHA